MRSCVSLRAPPNGGVPWSQGLQSEHRLRLTLYGTTVPVVNRAVRRPAAMSGIWGGAVSVSPSGEVLSPVEDGPVAGSLPDCGRPLRSDARKNRARLLAAAD